MTKATHNGTCQACGRVQAVRSTGRLAKHGYTVDYGYFMGVCHGADHLPLEQDTKINEKTVKGLEDWATERDFLSLQETFDELPVQVYDRKTRRYNIVFMDQATLEENAKEFGYYNDWDRRVERYRDSLRADAKASRLAAERLVVLRKKTFGQPLKERPQELELFREEFYGNTYAEGYGPAAARAEELKAAGAETVTVRRNGYHGFEFRVTYRAANKIEQKETV